MTLTYLVNISAVVQTLFYVNLQRNHNFLLIAQLFKPSVDAEYVNVSWPSVSDLFLTHLVLPGDLNVTTGRDFCLYRGRESDNEAHISAITLAFLCQLFFRCPDLPVTVT